MGRNWPQKWLFLFLLAGVSFHFLESSQEISFAKNTSDQCITCHTDINKMKALIAKFPEPPEEEGEA